MIANSPTKNGLVQSSVFEQITRNSPNITLAFYWGLALLFAVASLRHADLNFWEKAGLFAVGLFLWTFLEYILHRFVFHVHRFLPFTKKIQDVLHGLHHQNPRDAARLLMAPLPGTILAVFIFFLLYLFAELNALVMMTGMLSGYLFYSHLHFRLHKKPNRLFFHKLRTHHLLHHNKFPDKAFGITSPLWDIIFRTMPPEA
jgi:4-hydroxysphinganine ceramide fatty acyl 2-hydroxylase